MYPSVVSIKLIINHEQSAKVRPIIASHRILFPLLANPGFPAEIKIMTPATDKAIIPKGTAIVKTINLYILTNISKNLGIVQSAPSHGTSPAAFINTGANTNRKNNIGNIYFFMFFKALGALARIRTRKVCFEGRSDIQFHHEGLIITRLLIFYLKN